METKRVVVTIASIVLICMGLIACSRTRTDAAIVTDVQQRIQSDASISTKSISVQSNSGVVVLSGNVASEDERTSAENAAKQVNGVKGVVNNLQVVTAAATPSVEQPQAAVRPSGAAATAKPTPTKAMKSGKSTAAALPKPMKPETPAITQPAPPTPEITMVTIPEGTNISIRLIDPVDTAKNKEGDTFHASLDSPIVLDEKTVVPKDADAEVRLVSAKSAGHFTGSSAVVLVLTKITVGGKTYDIQTGEFTRQGASRGKRTAAVIGGGAAAGALIGGIAGGGKGAAIGAAAGAGAGTGVQAMTKGQQLQLPSETVLEFQLRAPLTVPTTGDVPKREKVG